MIVSYRFEPDYTVEGRHYAHPLVSWPTIIAGAMAAIAIGFLLNVLAAAIGASAFNPYEFNRQDETLSIGGGLYAVFAQFIAFQAGGYIAARSARFPDHWGGALNGFMVWALAVFVAVVLAAWTVASAAGASSVSAGVAEVVGQVSNVTDAQPANPADLATAEDAADALAAISWWAVGALGLGLAGAIAGGWLGAHHPKWDRRPRLDDRAAYQNTPII